MRVTILAKIFLLACLTYGTAASASAQKAALEDADVHIIDCEHAPTESAEKPLTGTDGSNLSCITDDGLTTTSSTATGPVIPVEEWEKRQNADERLTVFGTDLLGDGIDPHTGSISFQQTDVSLPGNSALIVAVTRKLSQGEYYRDNTDVEFGNWQIDTPRIAVTTAVADPWLGLRCSESFAENFGQVLVTASHSIGRSTYSNGVSLHAPGHAPQQLLEDPNGAQWPAVATHVTLDKWYLTCGSASDGGEGFIAHAPNGDQYRFDRFISREAPSLGSAGGVATARQVDMLAATEVTDVHGNWVRYEYDSSDRLTRIHSNDGRQIDLYYEVYGKPNLISRVVANGRTWTYNYSRSNWVYPEWHLTPAFQAKKQTLDSVTLPDGTQWTFDLDNMAAGPKPADLCQTLSFEFSVTHPTGVMGVFKTRDLEHRYAFDKLTRGCDYCPDIEPFPIGGVPIEIPIIDNTTSRVMSVTKKELSGPLFSNLVWSFHYEQDNGGAGTSGGDRANWTKVTGPIDHITYVHQWENEYPAGGKLIRKEIREVNGGPILQSEERAYQGENVWGDPFYSLYLSYKRRPDWIEIQTITRDGDSYTENYTYDTDFSSLTYSYGFPLSTSESSTLQSQTRTTVTEYEHNSSAWILGLPTKITRNGEIFDEFDYDAAGRMLWYDKFGDRAATMTYHSSGDKAGLLHTYTDALNRLSRISSYKRGVPTNLIVAEGTSDEITLSRTVDDNGWVTSSKNARGYTTGYDYNDVGWLTQIDRHSPWSDTDISYSGLGSGVVMTSTRGDARIVTRHDGFNRPILVEKHDLSGVASTVYTKTDYDALGREIFTSFPSLSSSPTTGAETEYDALGRVTRSWQNVTPYAETVTAYLTGNRVQVTDPEGEVTTTTSSGYGSPDDGNPVLIEQPEGVDTVMTYNVYGNLLTAPKGAFTQTWDYDDRLRLCRHYTPETGATLYDHNDADELISEARGQTSSTCLSHSSFPAADKIFNIYDGLGRIKEIKYPGGVGNVVIRYNSNGGVTRKTRGASEWTYDYDTADQLIEECSGSATVRHFGGFA